MDVLLLHALRVHPSMCVAFIGAGGKTTALFKLARELPSPVIVTATTHLGTWQTSLANRHIVSNSTSMEGLDEGLNGILLITGEMDNDRTKPANENLLQWLYRFCKRRSIPLLIEADGSQQKPLKAWAEHEPPIPSFTDLVVQVAGLSGLGKSLADENVHRAEIFSKLCGLDSGATVTPEALTQVLLHKEGGLKNIHPRARKVVLLNQADDAEKQSIAYEMTPSLLAAYDSVVTASLAQEKVYAVHEPIAGIVLAAGGSRRFGQPKQLLEYKGQSFVRTVASTALKAGLSPVIVVTGSQAEDVEKTVNGLNVTTVRNKDWEKGQGNSIQCGVKALPSRIGGAIFLLADQPQATVSIVRALVEKHAEGLPPIVAPLIADRRGNPVLFDRTTFPDLLELDGDTGGRAVFHKHRVEYLAWHDESVLFDVDTPEQYQNLISGVEP